MSEPSSARRIFSLSEARDLLPRVKALTAVAVEHAEHLTAEFEATSLDAGLAADDGERARIGEELNQIVAHWAVQMGELGLEAKGPWLVDFDNGSGYYCWRHPEDAVLHFHGYDEGFAGRMKIV
jgi:hypothetical protein